MTRKALISLVLLAALVSGARADDSSEKPVTVKPALLVIDIQNKYIPMMDEDEQTSAMSMINGLIWHFRQRELPIISVYHTDPQWGPPVDSEDFEFPESVIIQEDDPKFVKNFPSAFVETELHDYLQEEGINTLFLCGLSGTGCVLATYFGAVERHYDVFMIEGAILSPDDELTATVIDITSSIAWPALDVMLRAISNQ